MAAMCHDPSWTTDFPFPALREGAASDRHRNAVPEARINNGDVIRSESIQAKGRCRAALLMGAAMLTVLAGATERPTGGTEAPAVAAAAAPDDLAWG